MIDPSPQRSSEVAPIEAEGVAPERASEVAVAGAARRSGSRGYARGLLWFAAGAAVALPLAACQPNAPKPASRQADAVTTTQPAAVAEAAPRTVEVVKERIVYVDRPTAAPAKDEVLATFAVARDGGKAQEVRFSDVRDLILRSYGLNATLNVIQLKLARAEAQGRGLKVGEQDVKDETELTLTAMFPEARPEDHPTMLGQLLQQQKLSRAEFDVVMETNANLRKIAVSQFEPTVKEETLREAFNVLYGETVRTRHIACTNLQEIAEAQRRLTAGVPFDAVARELSRNPRTAPLGGELPPFSRAATDVAPAFRDAAFALKDGEVSDPVQAEGFYHLIKLDRKVPPRAVRFEDVKDGIAKDLRGKAADAAVRQLRQNFGDQARQSIRFVEPALAEQWKQRVEAAERAAPAPAAPTGR